METPPTTLMPPAPAPRAQDLTGSTLMLLATCVVTIYLVSPLLGSLAAAALIGAGALLISYQQPFLLIAALLLVAPFNYGHQVGPAMLKLSELVCFVMLGLNIWRLAVLHSNQLARLRLLAFPFTVLTLLGLMVLLTAAPHEHFFNARYEIENFIAFAFGALFFSRRHWPAFVRLALATLTLAALAALIMRFVFHISAISFFSEVEPLAAIGSGAQDVDIYAGGRFRLAGTFGHKNILAAFLVLLLPLLGMELFRKFRPTLLVALLPALAALALTDSMTGWGAALLILAVMLFFLRRFDYLALLLMLLVPIGAVALYKFGESVFYRIHQLLSTSQGWTTVSSRGEIYAIAARLIKQHPLLGIGRNNFLVEGHTYYTHAHNLYLMKIVEMGLPAGIVFTLFIGMVLGTVGYVIVRQAPRLSAQHQYYRLLGLWLGCVGVFAMNLFDYSYSNFALGPVLMLCLGITLAVALDLESLENPRPAATGGHTSATSDAHEPLP
jgi:O-antigen ligase